MFLSVLAGAHNGYKHLSLVTVLKVDRQHTYGKMCTSGLQRGSYDALILRKGYGSPEEGMSFLSQLFEPYGTLDYLILCLLLITSFCCCFFFLMDTFNS